MFLKYIRCEIYCFTVTYRDFSHRTSLVNSLFDIYLVLFIEIYLTLKISIIRLDAYRVKKLRPIRVFLNSFPQQTNICKCAYRSIKIDVNITLKWKKTWQSYFFTYLKFGSDGSKVQNYNNNCFQWALHRILHIEYYKVQRARLSLIGEVTTIIFTFISFISQWEWFSYLSKSQFYPNYLNSFDHRIKTF